MNTSDSVYIKKRFGAKVLAILKRLGSNGNNKVQTDVATVTNNKEITFPISNVGDDYFAIINFKDSTNLVVDNPNFSFQIYQSVNQGLISNSFCINVSNGTVSIYDIETYPDELVCSSTLELKAAMQECFLKTIDFVCKKSNFERQTNTLWFSGSNLSSHFSGSALGIPSRSLTLNTSDVALASTNMLQPSFKFVPLIYIRINT